MALDKASLTPLISALVGLGCAAARAPSARAPAAAEDDPAASAPLRLCDEAMPEAVDAFAAADGPHLDLDAPATAVLAASLDRTAITSVVREHSVELRACYDAGLVRDPNLRGRIAARWTVVHGAVEDVELSEGDLPDACVVRCVLDAIATWEFPRLRAAESVTITYPFRFAPP